MKHLFCLLAFSLILGFTAQAQSKEDANVAAAVEQLKQAMISGDRQALEAITAKDLSYGHSGGKIEDKAGFVEALTSGKSDFVTIDLTNQTIQVNGKTAIVRHHLTANTNDKGVPATVKLGVLLVWQKEHGHWKLLARQAFKQ
ncbi:nuclear transport factor 2 family protein [Rufibacter soli]